MRGWENKEQGLTQQLKVGLRWTPENRGPPTGSHGSEPSRGSKGLCGRETRSLPERRAEVGGPATTACGLRGRLVRELLL